MQMLKSALHALGRRYVRTVVEREYRLEPLLPNTNERPIEYAFVFRWLNALQPKTVLDVGTGLSALPWLIRASGFQTDAVDNIREYWGDGIVNRHYHVLHDDIRNPQIGRTYDMVTCISVLEHIPEHQQAVKSMIGLLNDRGHLLLTHPYNETRYVEDVYKLPGSYGVQNNFIAQQYSRMQVEEWLRATGARVVDQEYWQLFENGNAWSCGALVRPPRQTSAKAPHQLTCLLIAKH
jgi:SAM-dependent methyltransferase